MAVMPLVSWYLRLLPLAILLFEAGTEGKELSDLIFLFRYCYSPVQEIIYVACPAAE